MKINLKNNICVCNSHCICVYIISQSGEKQFIKSLICESEFIGWGEKILFWKGGIILDSEAREEALLHDKMALEGTLLERILRRMAGLFVKEK